MPKHPFPNCDHCGHRASRMFCSLEDKAHADFASIGAPVNYPKGVQLFSEGGQSSSVFVVCSGQVKLFCSSREGKTLILKIATPGDVLGLGAVISGSNYEVTAETTQPSQVKNIHRKDFLDFLGKHGEGSLHAAKVLSDDYKSAFFDARLLALSGSASSRLASVLLKWGKREAIRDTEMRFTMALTHEELANMLGTSRETITRTLTRFKREHLIEVHGSSILILAPQALEDLSV